MSHPIIDSIVLTKWIDLEHVKSFIDKGYTASKHSENYTLTQGGFTHYVLDCNYYYLDDIGDGETKEDVLTSYDSIEFWAATNNPVKELAQRLQKFESVCESVIGQLEIIGRIYGLTIDSVPTQVDDNYIFTFVSEWAGFHNKDLLNIPCGLEQANDHIQNLVYKWRKMVELYNNVKEKDLLYEYLITYDK